MCGVCGVCGLCGVCGVCVVCVWCVCALAVCVVCVMCICDNVMYVHMGRFSLLACMKHCLQLLHLTLYTAH